MKKGLYLLAIAAFLQLVFLVSCSDDDCGGPFPNRFRTIGLELQNLKLVSFNTATNNYLFEPLAVQEVANENNYFIGLTPVKENYTAFRQSPGFSFIDKAYACSPMPPRSEEVITSITITADKDFNAEYTRSENLAALFDVIVVDDLNGVSSERMSVPELLTLSPNMKDQLYFVLNTAPEHAGTYKFKFQINLSLAGEEKVLSKETQEVMLDPGA